MNHSTTQTINQIAESAHVVFEAETKARDDALSKARALTRASANAIRAIHRGDSVEAHRHLDAGKNLFSEIAEELKSFPGLYYAGYTTLQCESTAKLIIILKTISNLNINQ